MNMDKIIKKANENGWNRIKPKDAYYVRDILFDHSFAKAIFGDYVVRWCREHVREKCKEYKLDHVHVGWEFRLKEAVVSDDPIQYYIDHLDERVTKKWDINKKEVK